MAYIGPYNSGAAGVSMPILNEEGLVQVSPAVTWVGLTKKNESAGPDEPDKYRPSKRVTFARVCPTDETQGPMAADFARDDLKVKSVYILDDNEIYGTGVSGLFERRARAIGLAVLGHEGINPNQQDFTPLMISIKAKNPGALYFGGTTQSKGGQLAKDMKKVGLGCPLIVPDGCYELSFIESAGAENLANCYATMGGVDLVALMRTGADSEFVKQYRDRFKAGADFVTKYQAKFQKDPEAYAVYGYEAAKAVLEGIKAVGKKDREAILKAVIGTKDFDKGALGKWSFDADGDISLQNLTISRIKDGRFELVKVVDKTK
jgi:branched-chain amino acid transport system substrate-binding protein